MWFGLRAFFGPRNWIIMSEVHMTFLWEINSRVKTLKQTESNEFRSSLFFGET